MNDPISPRLVALCLLCALVSACSGVIGEPERPGGGAGSSPSEGPGLAGPSQGASKLVYECTDPKARGASDQKLRRLTQPELVATLGDLLGSDVMADSAIRTQLGLLTADRVITSILDVAESPPDSQPAAMLEIALRAADLVMVSAAARARVFGACASATQLSETCLTSFVSEFGQKVYRRPVAEPEAQAVIAQYRAAPDGAEGMRRILARLLLSPSLVFHVEPGASTELGRVRLSDHEVASRLAYRITGTMPDDLLLQAAARGELHSLTALRSQAQRLIESEAVKNRVRDFFRFYTQLYSIPAPNAFAARLDGIQSPAALQAEMAQETLDFIEHVVWTRSGGFEALMTSREVFPRSADMATILEASLASGSTPSQTTVDHRGLLLRPSFLADAGKVTRPYHRALRVRSGLLCESFALPDPNAIAARQDALGDLSMMSNRERLTAETDTPLCLACHGKLNPVGFVLESHDQLGMKRSLESSFDETSGDVLQTHPIDTAVQNTQVRDDKGVVASFADPQDLIDALVKGKEARACLAQRMFEYQRVRPQAAADACALHDVEATLATGGSFVDAFITSVVNEDIFYKAEGS